MTSPAELSVFWGSEHLGHRAVATLNNRNEEACSQVMRLRDLMKRKLALSQENLCNKSKISTRTARIPHRGRYTTARNNSKKTVGSKMYLSTGAL